MLPEEPSTGSNDLESPVSDDDDEDEDDLREPARNTKSKSDQQQEQSNPLLRPELLGTDSDKEKLQKILWSQYTEEELNRYEMFRRSTFPKASVKRLMQSISGSSVSQNVVIAMSGIAKVFVGELVEEAIRIQNRYGESGPVEPRHLREAFRVIENRSDRTVHIQ